jgi:hypothetical protein
MTMITSITLLAQEIRRSAARSPLLVKLRSTGGSLGPYSASIAALVVVALW